MTPNLAALCAATSVFISPLPAQTVSDRTAELVPKQTLEIDLNHDGHNDEVRAFDLPPHFELITWRIRNPNSYPDFYGAFITPDNLSESPTLDVNSNQNLKINWGCFACAGLRNTQMSATLRFQDNALWIIGYDEFITERRYAVGLSCSANLLTRDVSINAADVETKNFKSKDQPYPVTDLINQPTPEGCAELSRYDDAWMQANIPKE